MRIDLSDLALRHRRCPKCEYQFVWPRIPQTRLIDCYSRASADYWGTGADVAGPRSYAHKKTLLERFSPGRSALDFGCFDGGFLDYLGDGWSKAGIEPSRQAAAAAQTRGVKIIAPTLEAVDLQQYAGRFAAVIIFDVMEHVPDPVGDLSRLREMLISGGIALIETGNTDARDWQRFGNRHPYCGAIEHIGFFNRRSIDEAGRRAGLTLVHFEPSVHFQRSQGLSGGWLHVWGYHAIRGMCRLKLPLPRRLRDIAAGPVPRGIDLQDHFLAVLQRR